MSRNIRQGFVSGLPVAVGYYFVAVAFGLLVRSASLGVFQGQGFSLFVFAGASQFAALSMLKEGLALPVIILIVFVMNLRHFLMSSSLRPRMTGIPKVLLPLAAFGITDETFAVASLKDGPLTASYLLTLNTMAWTGWNLGTLTGILAGSLLPASLNAAMNLGLYILFAALLIPAVRKQKKGIFLALSAAAVHSVLKYMVPGIKSWAFLIAVIAVCAVNALLPEKSQKEAADE